MTQILLVEDDLEIGHMLKSYLSHENVNLTVATTCRRALDLLNRVEFDLLVLDLGLPDYSGLDLLKDIRKKSDIIIIIISAKTDDIDKIFGLELGADDYLSKPFNPRELKARIDGHLRRAKKIKKNQIYTTSGINVLNIDFNNQIAIVNDKMITLTRSEFYILEVLFKNANSVISKQQLLKESLGRNYEPFDRSLDIHLHNIRKKLNLVVEIKTIHGVGYLLVN